jgi:Flp pilus assembly protein TadG
MVSLIRGNRGQSVVEFALVLPVLLLVLFGITELGRAVMVKNVLTSAAREGARLAIVTDPDKDAVKARVESVCRAAGITDTTVKITNPDENTGQIEVTVQSQFVLIPGSKIFNYFGGDSFPGTLTIGATSVMRHEAL